MFLFEWTLILYKTNNSREAENKALVTYASNSYIFDAFLGKDLKKIQKAESSNWQQASLLDHFEYSCEDDELKDFAAWLEHFMSSYKYRDFVEVLTQIDIALESEPVGKRRSELVNKRYRLINFQ